MSKAKIKQFKESIGKLSKWEKSGNVFGFIEKDAGKNPDYLYEFFCAMKILRDLKKSHDISLVKGTRGYKFPKKPGNKANWAKFLILDKNTKLELSQFCLGSNIEISLSPQTTFGADISFQTAAAPDNPNENHVILIMDAKYKKSSASKLEIATIREFAQCVTDMQTPKSQQSGLVFSKLSALNANCLFTNGEGMDEHHQYCKNRKLKQVGRFDCDGRTMQIIG